MNLEDGDYYLERYLPHAFVGLLMAYMAWIRLLPREQAFGDGEIFFTANDPWYHVRVNHYLVENYPTVFRFDVFTHFPFGSPASTGYGGLFNHLTTLAALIVGLGSPSEYQIELVTAFAPVAFGVAAAVPLYLLARRFTDRVYGLVGVLALALITGQYLNRTTFANAQHQSAEAFFMLVAILGVIYTVDRAYGEKPTFAHLQDRDWTGLKPSAVGSLVGGVCLGLYLMTWPAGIFLVVPLGFFVVLQMVREHMKGESTEYIALSMAGAFLVAAALVFLWTALNGFLGRFAGLRLSVLQPMVLATAGVGLLFLAGVSTYLKKEGIERAAFPAVVVASFAVAFLFVWAVGLMEYVERLVRIVYGFGLLTGAGAGTIAEVTPATPMQAISDYGLLWILGLLAMAWMVVRVVLKDRPLELLLVLWGATMYSAYFTQGRFGYYMALAVAFFSAYAVYHAVKLLEIDEVEIDLSDFEKLGESLLDVKGYQLIAIVMLLFLFLPVLVIGLGPGMSPAWESVRAGGDEPWQQDSLEWMSENTPEPGVEYLADYGYPEGEDFDYPVDESPVEGAYGVLSWWDYGHWIMHRGERIPNANPFQEGNFLSSDFMTSQSEERANLVLDALPSLEPDARPHRLSNDELEDTIEAQDFQEANEDTRYVMIDDQMAAGKFGAIGTWTGFTGDDYVERKEIELGDNFTESLIATGEGYDDTTLARLYFDDARSMETYRLVHETETYGLIASMVDLGTGQQQFNQLFNRIPYNQSLQGMDMNVQQLGAFVQRDQAIRAGGNSYLYDIRTAASVKTYERVEGATLTGESEHADEEVLVRVGLETTNTDRAFSYAQNTSTDADGRFEVTVPYATEHDVDVDEGGTESAVEATGPYEVYVGDVGVVEVLGDMQVIGQPHEVAEVEVPETDVYFGEEVSVDLQEAEVDEEMEEEIEDVADVEDDVEDDGLEDGLEEEEAGDTE